MIYEGVPHLRQLVQDETHVGEARRWASRLTIDTGLDDADAGRANIIVTELARNLLKHAGGGELLLAPISSGPLRGIEIISIDRGKGLNPEQAMRDGYSTSGTPGTGLGAVRRQSDLLDMFTAADGTVLLAQVWAGRRVPEEATMSVGAVCVPTRGERECGDQWAAVPFGGRVLLSVVDGLGHGPEAAIAAKEAIRILKVHAAHSPSGILDRVHDALRKTRGAAMAVAEWTQGSKDICYAGIGNIDGRVLGESKAQSMISHNGTLGAIMRCVQDLKYPFARTATLVMHSDGLQSNWDVQKYPGLLRRHPTLTAAVLYRDSSRGRDDVTVLVARET